MIPRAVRERGVRARGIEEGVLERARAPGDVRDEQPALAEPAVQRGGVVVAQRHDNERVAALDVRGGGSAMAIFFFYITLLEPLTRLLIGRFAPAAAPFTRFAPFNHFTTLLEGRHFDPSLVDAAHAEAAAASQTFVEPDLYDPALLLSVGAGWIALFVVLSFVVFRRRDL